VSDYFEIPERPLDPPEHWNCEECGNHFYPDENEETAEDELVLCYECKSFDG
jgi:NAD-dependent SIR2 family protein deacetylase